MEKFFFSWDRTSIITSLICIALLCGIIVYVLKYTGWVRWLTLSVCFIAFVIPVFLFPCYVTKDAERLLVHFVGYTKEVRLSDYESITLKENGLNDLSRICASEDYMGYWGKWRDQSGREYTSYVMDKSKNIYVLTPRNKINKKAFIIINLPENWVSSIITQ